MDSPFFQITEALKEALKGQDDESSHSPAGQFPLLDKDCFHLIDSATGLGPVKIAFVDGGNAEIIASANFSLHAVNLARCIYSGPKKIGTASRSGYILITAKSLSGKLFYEANFFGYPLSKVSIDASHPSIAIGFQRPSPGALASPLRKALELSLAADMAQQLEDGSWIALDGDFSTPTPFEREALNNLIDASSERNIGCLALAKTSDLLSGRGDALIPLIKEISPKQQPWFYAPIPPAHKTIPGMITAVASLHKRPSHCFKLEVIVPKAKPSAGPGIDPELKNLNPLMKSLVENSKDSVFLGYPYGFIEADQLARVSNQEKGYQKTKLLAALGKNFPEINDYLATKDAHAILDRMRF
ncbi:DNA double-strand break repair nuclease NurA [Candidatus Woesearchaeota archaeon]|nr:DNA double-strand break repair nuclease NurA [Candidatus Woesearchaeota archaeon]